MNGSAVDSEHVPSLVTTENGKLHHDFMTSCSSSLTALQKIKIVHIKINRIVDVNLYAR